MHDAAAEDAEQHQLEQDEIVRRLAEQVDRIEAQVTKMADRDKDGTGG
jgi:hypothetical protein